MPLVGMGCHITTGIGNLMFVYGDGQQVTLTTEKSHTIVMVIAGDGDYYRVIWSYHVI